MLLLVVCLAVLHPSGDATCWRSLSKEDFPHCQVRYGNSFLNPACDCWLFGLSMKDGAC